MQPGFVQPYPLMRYPTFDGLNAIFAGHLFYVDRDGVIHCTPEGGTTDGPSIPQWAQGLIKRYGKGIYGPAGQHDGGYQGYGLIWNPAIQQFIPAPHEQKYHDDLLDEAMEVCGLDAPERIIVFEALRTFGGYAWNDDLSLALPKITIPKGLPPALQTFGI